MPQSIERNTYTIDAEDKIVSVGPEWDTFARLNNAPELIAGNVIGRGLWGYIANDTLRHIYEDMVASVRSGKTLHFDFRCDAPEKRRFLEMHLTPCENGGVQFETLTTREESRESQNIFRRSERHSKTVVVTCSWCKKLNIGGNKWAEVEDALRELDLFEIDPAPQLSHGICGQCFEVAVAATARA